MGRPTRNLYVGLPPELGLHRTMLGKLKRCLYGTRDAGHIWESVYGEALIIMGFVQGKVSPCCFDLWCMGMILKHLAAMNR